MLNRSFLPNRSLNTSKFGGLGTSVGNKSQPVVPEDNLSQDEAERQDDEFAYCTHEDSIFKSFEDPEEDQGYPRPGAGISTNKESKSNVKTIKSVLKKFSESSKTYEFLVKF